jgi:hypothetical protein
MNDQDLLKINDQDLFKMNDDQDLLKMIYCKNYDQDSLKEDQ